MSLTLAQRRMQELSGRQFIDGQALEGTGTRRHIVDPATEAVIDEWAEASADEVDRAVAASARAQKAWWARGALERANAMHRVASRLEALAPEAGECLTREMGKPFREAHWQIGASASSFRYYAEIARHEQGRV